MDTLACLQTASRGGIDFAFLVRSRAALLGALGTALGLGGLAFLLLRLAQPLVDRGSCVGHGLILYNTGVDVNRRA